MLSYFITHMHEDLAKAKIFEGLNNSSLDERVKGAAKKAITDNLSMLSSAMTSFFYQAPEVEIHTQRILEGLQEVIGPVFMDCGVQQPEWRDAFRDIYVALDGNTPPQYETK